MIKTLMNKVKSMIEPQFLSTYVTTIRYTDGAEQLLFVDAYSREDAANRVANKYSDITIIDVK